MHAFPAPAGTNPRVSVCMPVFNGATFLREAVTSVLAQTYRDFELCVFDNASTDSTWEILESFRDPRIRSVRNPENIGAERNWNLALEAANGTYLKMLHHDDLLEPTCLAEQVMALERHPGAVLAFSSRTIIGTNSQRIMTRIPPWPQGEVPAQEIVQGCLRAGTNLVGECCGVLVRSHAARATGGFNGRIPYVIDLDYWVRLLKHGSGYCLKAPLASYRISPDQWSAAIGKKQCRQFIEFMDHLAASGLWPVGRWAQVRGKAMAYRNQWLRMLVYRCLALAGR